MSWHRLWATAAALIALSCTPVLADEQSPEVWLNPGFYSWHFDRDANLRDNNVGFGVEAKLADDHGLMGGSYANSDWARSHYVGYQWRPLHWAIGETKVDGGVVIVALDGYPNMRSGGWYLAALPLIAIEGKRLGLNFTVIPTVENRLHGAITFQIKLRVW